MPKNNKLKEGTEAQRHKGTKAETSHKKNENSYTTKIAIIKLSAIGDIIHCLPVASALRKKFPNAHLTWIVEGKGRKVLAGHPDLDEIILFDKNRWSREFPYPHRTIPVLWEAVSFFYRLRKANFDIVIDLQGLIKSGLLTWFTKAKTRIGFTKDYCREPANIRFTNLHLRPEEKDVHIVDQNLSLVRHLGVDTQNKEFKITIPDKDKQFINTFLEKKKIKQDNLLILINPGTAWETKCWGEENFACLADQLILKYKAVIIFLWGPSELPLVKSIQKKMNQRSYKAFPTTLKQSMALMQKVRLLIAGDTGSLHMAAALGTPCLGIYGPTSPQRNGPYGKGHRVIHTRVSCRNCFQRYCTKKICMQSIKVQEVIREVRKMLL